MEEEQPVKLRAALHSPDGSTPGTWAGRCGTALLTAPLGWVEEPARVRACSMCCFTCMQHLLCFGHLLWFWVLSRN